MVTEFLWPDNAPWWLNLFIWMAYSWQYILIGFVPAFYIAIVQLFGFPLLQRWAKEVVIILHPTKVKFGKIEDEKEPYFAKGKCLYWSANPLQPEITTKEQTILEQMQELKTRYEELSKETPKTKKIEKTLKIILKHQKQLEKHAFEIKPINQIQIFTQSINQAIYEPERIETKATDLLAYESKIKSIKKHGIWIMQNPKAHFHRHYKIIIKETGDFYKIIPVKERQQFAIGFWHSLGIEILQKIEVPVEQGDEEVSSGSRTKMMLIGHKITTSTITQQIKMLKQNQNFSSSKCYRFLEARKKTEYSFGFKLLGLWDIRVILALGGMIGAIVVLFVFMHGGGSLPGVTKP